jgi:hypothetical protein
MAHSAVLRLVHPLSMGPVLTESYKILPNYYAHIFLKIAVGIWCKGHITLAMS